MRGVVWLLWSLIAGAAQAEVVRCMPDHAVFCRNVHVGCAGRLAEPAPSFVADLAAGSVAFEGGAPVSVGVSHSHSGVVLRPEDGAWWIRIDPQLRFSQRVSLNGAPAMSVGWCKQD